MSLKLYNTYELARLVAVSHSPATFLLDLFFPTIHEFDTEYVLFDKVEGNEGLAPFVAPDADGQPLSSEGYTTESFAPAYISLEEAVTPRNAMTRRAGEAPTGALSPQQRLTVASVEKLQKFDNAIYRRLEWMAAKTLFSDGYVVEGDNYPAQHIKFNRKADHNVTLTGTEMWSDPTADITGQFEAWSTNILDVTGYAGDTVVMGNESWALMRQNKGFKEYFDRYKGNYDVPDIAPETAKKVQYKGKWGEFHIFVYSGSYKDGGKRERFIPEHEVVMGSVEGLHGTQCYGVIQRVDAMYPMAIYREQYIPPKKKSVNVLAESAPLIVPGNPNAIVKAKVA